MKNKLNPTQKLVLSAIIMALYIAILFISQAISFGAIQMRLNKCPTRSVMDRFRIGSSTLICFKNPPMRIVKIITMSIQTRWPVMIFLL